MTDKHDGGPAFAHPATFVSPDNDRAYVIPAEKGMSLRAYAAIHLRVPDSGIEWLDDMIRQAKRDDFAGQAMATLLSKADGNQSVRTFRYDEIASLVSEGAYAMADAMLKARED